MGLRIFDYLIRRVMVVDVRYVIVANGLAIPNELPLGSLDLVENCTTASVNGEDYAGKVCEAMTLKNYSFLLIRRRRTKVWRS